MTLWNRLRSWLRATLHRNRTESEMDAELSFHIAAYADDLLRAGVPHEQAVRRARLEFGGLEQAKEECRDARGVTLIETLVQDVRFSLRMLRKNPGFAIIAMVTLALGIGANAGVFSFVNGVLLNPLPYPHPEQLVALHESKPNFPTGSISLPNFKDWKRANRSFSGMALSRPYSFSITGSGESEKLRGRFVSSGFFSVLGVNPMLGRDFAPGEDEIGAAPVAMISASLWQRKFGASPDVIGHPLKLDGRNYTIVGIVSPTFDLLTPAFRTAEVYVPLGQWDNNALKARSAGLALHGFARLKSGVTIEQARADMASVTHALALEYPADDKGVGATIVPLREEMLGKIGPVLWMLLGAVAFVLLIACVNVGNLLLARASSRVREVAIRSALGAAAGRLVRQLLTESVLLALAGATLGLVLASWGTRAALQILPTALPRSSEIGVDHRVLAFTFLISLLAGILFGLAPAVKLLHSDLQHTLKDGGRGANTSKHRAQGIFVMFETALALVLLAGAGLMVRSLSALWSVNPGFRPDGVLYFGLSLPPSMANSPPDAIRAALRQTEARFAATPGIKAVSLSWGALPMGGDDEQLFWMPGQPKPSSEADMNWSLRYIVGPDYLRVMRIPLLKGRFFTNHDDNHAPLVAVVDEEFAHKFFPGQNPIGKRLEFQDPAGEAQIVGLVAHVKQWGLDTDANQTLRAQLYMPILQQDDALVSKWLPGVDVVVRCASSPMAVFDALRRSSAAVNREQVLFGAQTMKEIIAETIAARRFSMLLLGAFATLALVLAMIGVYGVISYSVGRRTNEIGVRMALGARRNQVFRLVLSEGMQLALFGTLLGLVAALLMTRLLSGLLYGVSAHDPLTLAGVAFLLSTVAAIACWIPARRAMRIDPMAALRHE